MSLLPAVPDVAKIVKPFTDLLTEIRDLLIEVRDLERARLEQDADA